MHMFCVIYPYYITHLLRRNILAIWIFHILNLFAPCSELHWLYWSVTLALVLPLAACRRTAAPTKSPTDFSGAPYRCSNPPAYNILQDWGHGEKSDTEGFHIYSLSSFQIMFAHFTNWEMVFASMLLTEPEIRKSGGVHSCPHFITGSNNSAASI